MKRCVVSSAAGLDKHVMTAYLAHDEYSLRPEKQHAYKHAFTVS